jgi:ribonuclease J
MKSLDKWLQEKLFLKSKQIVPAGDKKNNLQKPAEKQRIPHFQPRQNHAPEGNKPRFFANEKDFLRIIPLGGLDQVGRNMTVFESQNDIVIIDCGLQFPEEGMLGIDYVIPDVSYLETRKNKIRGIVITHGHLDHIGALRHVLPKIGNPPVFASRLTIGLIQKQLEEFSMLGGTRLHAVEHTEHIRLGSFVASFARITHNVPGAMAVILKSSVGTIVHTGDFKFDFTAPFPNDVPDFEKLLQTGKEGVLFLLSDSTNANQEGYARPEIEVGENLDMIIRQAKGRVIIGSFASNLARVQQMVNSAIRYERKVFLSGRSMVNNMAIAKKLGYVKFPEKSVSKISKAVNDLPDNKILIITTGSQGEEFAALSRMANDQHAQIQIRKGDTIVLSSTPIPGTGNERSIYNNINKFIKKEATVITNEDLDVHTSGHGKKEDLKLMLELTNPKYFIPVHGELFMRLGHKEIAREQGIAEDHIFLLQNGSILETKKQSFPIVHPKPLEIRNVYVDGLGGTESEGAKVLEERKNMSQDGVVIILYKVSSKDRRLVGAPKLISKGFIYMEELEKMSDSVIREARQIYMDTAGMHKNAKQKDIRWEIREKLGTFIYKKIGREPMIIPIVVEI